MSDKMYKGFRFTGRGLNAHTKTLFLTFKGMLVYFCITYVTVNDLKYLKQFLALRNERLLLLLVPVVMFLWDTSCMFHLLEFAKIINLVRL